MDAAEKDGRFAWANFYQAFAKQLLTWRSRRDERVAGIHQITTEVAGMSHLQDKPAQGEPYPLKDICPFTTIGLFNRTLTDANRSNIAGHLAKLIGVSETVPDSFAGVPVLNNQKSWFFSSEGKRHTADIDKLWEMFAQALNYADNPTNSANFIYSYDNASGVRNVGWNLTIGLYWCCPWFYPTLDSQSKSYIQNVLNITILRDGKKGRSSGRNYLNIRSDINNLFSQPDCPVHSFPELSLMAWNRADDKEQKGWKVSLLDKVKKLCLAKNSPHLTRTEFIETYREEIQAEHPDNNTIEHTISHYLQKLRKDGELTFHGNGKYQYIHFNNAAVPGKNNASYTLSHLIEEGCFLDEEKIHFILQRLKDKKNLILQGPPGTGKTWLARRLAYCLTGEKAPERISAVQFHPNLSYEDFIRGWRPGKEGRLELIDGPFVNAINKALNNPAAKYVVIIEEINRGNPAQIFGETLTLMEADKRTPTEALELSYRTAPDEKIYIPENLYIIGTMNIADRSLALLDLALRRRFAFIDLKPVFNEAWKNWVNQKFAVDPDVLNLIESRLTALNEMLANDLALGPQFCVGHSYVTPAAGQQIGEAIAWYEQVVETEICPLLAEYWFDAPNKVNDARKVLLAQ
ncbi:AAA family ATPase [Leclercia sp.]|uniref:AAA family ATPase n=1 Tax=Leclercia sp. TaxID=1898428 RepID=UPI0028A226B7|nr:AAA family ATPase [Leclercia sp.]